MGDVIPPGHQYPLDALGQPHPADLDQEIPPWRTDLLDANGQPRSGEVDESQIQAILENLKLTPSGCLRKHDERLRALLAQAAAGEGPKSAPEADTTR